ncbi:16S rRNA (cytosine(1402)-N(4))-methyltransferase RsmH [Pseudomonadota bacterium]|nr:16S rRNA (cytosine(1402)-N(4))-methyltransferase RsmH [Pseudomonadota bacterium]
MLHSPVLLEESIDFLITNTSGKYIDATFGRGGHSRKILDSISKDGELVALDKDIEAVRFAKENFKDNNFSVKHAGFEDIDSVNKSKQADGILFDFGLCSTHYDDPSRGFSFSEAGPLDMRIDQRQTKKLEDLLQTVDHETLANIIYQYGDEKESRKISQAIINSYKDGRILNTIDLAEVIKKSKTRLPNKIHPATQTFQALRIYLNDEINNLKAGLNKSKDLLKTGGRIVCISFHSHEDRSVKQSFAPKKISYPKEIPLNNEVIKEFKIVAKKIKPSASELQRNKRSRSAIMRVFEKM